MNLQSAKALSELRMPNKTKVEPKTKTAIQVARRVFKLAAQGGFPYKYHTPETWAKKWLASKEFVLMEIDINAAASPNAPKNPARVQHYLKCSVESLDPIVVDLNKRKVGKTRHGYVPEVVVHDGKHRKEAQIMGGRLTIMAWVGKKAVKKIKPSRLLKASASNNGNGNHSINGNGTVIDRLQFMHAAVVPGQNIPVKTADTGVGGSRPVGILHHEADKVKAGGPGSGRKPYKGQVVTGTNGEKYSITHVGRDHVKVSGGPTGKFKVKHEHLGRNFVEYGAEPSNAKPERVVERGRMNAGVDCNACGARSSGSLENIPDPSDAKIPPDTSDASRAVDQSDRLKFNPKKAQVYTPGTGPGYVNQFGSPNFQAPGAGSGPRVTNKGASGSDMARELHARRMRSKGKKVKRIWDAQSGKYIDAVAPPGKEDQVLKLKKKFGEKSATPFKIAWSDYHGKD